MTLHPATPVEEASGAAADTAVALEGLSYTYPAWSDQAAPALRDVTLTLHPGLTVVDGDSGSGKSTLLRVCNGLIPHFHGGSLRGRAVVCGLDVPATPTRRLARHVGFVFQEPELGFVRGTVAREVAFFPENLGLPGDVVRQNVEEALERVGIAGLAGRRLRTLSGGERQRVALAAALAGAPAVIALDEPLSQLDARGAAALIAALLGMAAAGTTVVVAEHRLGSTHLAGARRLRLASGGLAEAPMPSDVLAVSAGSRAATAGYPGGRSRAPRPGTESWSLRRTAIGVDGRPLLVDVDLAGAAGEAVIVTGANGSGKTTLLRTIAGLAPPLAGDVERRPGRIAYLPQEPGVLLHRQSVRDEIEQTLRWSKAGGTAHEVLDLLGLEGLADRDPRDLSGGQRQRAALAVVLAGRPALALLDEPTRGMDSAARTGLGAALRRLTEGGTAVVAATHDADLARELEGRVVRIEDGALLHSAEAGSGPLVRNSLS